MQTSDSTKIDNQNLDSQIPKFIHRFLTTSYGNSNLDTSHHRVKITNHIELKRELCVPIFQSHYSIGNYNFHKENDKRVNVLLNTVIQCLDFLWN